MLPEKPTKPRACERAVVDNHERYRNTDTDRSLEFEGETGKDVRDRLKELGYID
jgi:hypothetical protein